MKTEQENNSRSWITEGLVDRFPDQAFFIQIGSNDGISGDPIYPIVSNCPNWKGVLVEPIPFLFEQLKKNYKDHDNLEFEKSIISDSRGQKTIYFLPESLLSTEKGRHLPSWSSQLASLSRDHILKHLGNEIEGEIQSITISCQTFSDLCRKHDVAHVDILHIDTEGHDFVILRSIPLLEISPTIILFEHKHLSKTEQALARMLLKASGYSVRTDYNDTFAFRTSPEKAPPFKSALHYRILRVISKYSDMLENNRNRMGAFRKWAGERRRLLFR